MYAESRLPGVERDAFTARWRRHGALALSYDSFRLSVQRYVHRDPVEDPSDFPGASAVYDALGEITAADEAALRRALTSPDMTGPIRDDGAQTFARVRALNATVEERHVRAPQALPEPAVAISAFIAGDLEAAALTDRLTLLHQLLLERLESLDRLARCITVSPALDPHASWGTYVELRFHDRAAAAAAYAEYAPALAGATAAWVSRSIILVSTRHVLHQAAASGRG